MSSLFQFLHAPSVTTDPPTEQETRRNDWLLLASVLVLLAIGWGVRVLTIDAGRSIDLAIGLPAVAYPAGWSITTPVQADPTAPQSGVLFEARNPGAPSTYSPLLRIESLPVKQGEDLDGARVALSLRRSRELDRYRELAADPALVLDGRPALLMTYAYIADPTLDAGSYGLPVIVQAQDLIFRHETQWLIATVATVAADAADFADEQSSFDRFFESLALDRDVTIAEVQPEATPAFEGNQP